MNESDDNEVEAAWSPATVALVERARDLSRRAPKPSAPPPVDWTSGENAGRLRWMMRSAGIPDKYQDAQIERVRPRADVARYVGAVMENVARGHGLVFLGSTGVGKSSAAGLVGREALMAGCSVAWWYVPDLFALTLDERRHHFGRMIGADLLIWDDFGVQGITAFNLGFLDRVVERRYQRGLPMLVTTNLTTEGLRDPALARMRDRWRERSTAIVFAGESMRSTWRDER